MQVRVDERGKVIAQDMDTVLSLLKEIRESQRTSKCESCHTLEIKLRICKSQKEASEKRTKELGELLDKTATILAGLYASAGRIGWMCDLDEMKTNAEIKDAVLELGQEAFETNVMIRRTLSGDGIPVFDSPLD